MGCEGCEHGSKNRWRAKSEMGAAEAAVAGAPAAVAVPRRARVGAKAAAMPMKRRRSQGECTYAKM